MWTMSAELEKRKYAFEMSYYRVILNISYTDHVTDEDLRRKVLAASGTWIKGETDVLLFYVCIT